MSAPLSVDEAISAAQQAIAFDQDVDPVVVQVLLDEIAALTERQAAVLAVTDDAERRANELVGMFSGKKGADVPAWVGRIRTALGVTR